jgi:tyrosyl-tRNA synthetase
VTDFHSAEAAEKAAGNWAKQFQKDEVPEGLAIVELQFADLINIPFEDVEFSLSNEIGAPVTNLGGPNYKGVKFDRILVRCGLAVTPSEATRKIKEGAVRIGDHTERSPLIFLQQLPTELVIRLGHKLRRVRISSP